MTATATMHDEARRLRSLGLALCAVKPPEKIPGYAKWNTFSLEPDYFLENPNACMGIQAGPLSADAVVIDGDNPPVRAALVARLPRTAVDGRPGTGPAHWYFRVTDIPKWAIADNHVAGGIGGPRTRRFKDANKAHIGLDWQGTGAMVVCPPSLHKSGERREWFVEPEEIATIGFAELWGLVTQVARDHGAVNIDRYNPEKLYAQAHVGNGHMPPDLTNRVVKYLDKCEAAVSGTGGHDTLLAVARAVVWGFDFGEEAGFDILVRHYNPRCQPPWNEAELRHKCRDADTLPYGKPRGYLRDREREKRSGNSTAGYQTPSGNGGGKCTTPDESLEAADDPHRLARLYLERHKRDDLSTVIYWRDEIHRWDGRAYMSLSDNAVKAELTASTKAEFDRLAAKAREKWEAKGSVDEKGNATPPPVARKVTSKLIGDVRLALGSLTLLPGSLDAPAWLDISNVNGHKANECIAFANGILHVPTWMDGKTTLIQSTPAFFTQTALDFDFQPRAEPPGQWFRFLDSLWPDDIDAMSLLQEWMGYLLLPDTSQQKILLMIGPKRSGKGTIARVMRGIVGERNYVSPTLASLGLNFGLQPLVGKTCAVVSDARMSGRTDAAVVAERLLSLSGEDPVTIDRKFLPAVTYGMPIRFTVCTNELPRLGDASGALAGRFLILRLTRSFYGNEDHCLTRRLLTERAGILLWALEGLKRLHQRGRFLQPPSAEKLVQDLEDLSSPVGAFVRECCELGTAHEIEMGALYQSWVKWCETMGRENPGDRTVFGRNLRAAFTCIDDTVHRLDGRRVKFYTGLRVRDDAFV